MVNGLKTDMEHKNTNDKNEYHFQLPEVVVKGKMPGCERQNAGMDAQAIGNGTSPESCII